VFASVLDQPVDWMLAEETSISTEQMKLVLEVASRLAMTANLDELLRHIAQAATQLAEAERASIFLHDPKTNELWTKVALGLTQREIRLPASSGIVGHVFQSNETLLVPEPYDDPRFNRDVDRRTGYRTRNLLTVPVKNLERKQIGVLQVVNRIGGPFSDTDRTLIELLADQAGVAIQRNRLQSQAQQAAAMAKEIELAQKVQMAMIPTQPPEVPGLVAAGWVRPASVTGGDAYDLWRLADGRMGIFLGDASGHGLAPALVISQTRTLIRSLSEINCDPYWVLNRVNQRLSNDLEPGRFVTAFLACLAPDGRLNWCSAGHGPMFLRRRPEGQIEVMEPVGPPVGVVPDLACDPTDAPALEPGGTLVVMSDGVFESRGPSGELFEVHRVVELLDRHRGASPGEVVELIREAMRQWQGGDEPLDDQTVVVIQRTV
jgi:phosphoserine phosphatase